MKVDEGKEEERGEKILCSLSTEKKRTYCWDEEKKKRLYGLYRQKKREK